MNNSNRIGLELGGWFKNPDDKDGWSTTKQTEFVSAYAHGVNPNEDMAESISYYIVNPDKVTLALTLLNMNLSKIGSCMAPAIFQRYAKI